MRRSVLGPSAGLVHLGQGDTETAHTGDGVAQVLALRDDGDSPASGTSDTMREQRYRRVGRRYAYGTHQTVRSTSLCWYQG